jgi:hypothetical protein
MCRRDTNDLLVRRFLDDYRVNLLALPGRRVRCGSVYIKSGKHLTAPGSLSEILTPEITFPDPFLEEHLPDLSGTWSRGVSVKVGFGLLGGFLAAFGAGGIITDLQASAARTNTRNVAFSFNSVSRESLDVTRLGRSLIGRRLMTTHPLVNDGNRYYAVSAVLRSASISIQARDDNETAASLDVGIAALGKVSPEVKVTDSGTGEIAFTGPVPLAIAVELYELQTDEDTGGLQLLTQQGPLELSGLDEHDPPPPVFVGDDEQAMIAVEESAMPGVSA